MTLLMFLFSGIEINNDERIFLVLSVCELAFWRMMQMSSGLETANGFRKAILSDT